MKITNVSGTLLYFRGLKFVREAQNNGGRGEDRYLQAGQSIYVPNTTEVIRSAREGELFAWAHTVPPKITLEDTNTLAANGNPGDTVILNHGLGVPPLIYVLKQVGATWVDATGTYDAVHDATFNIVTITNATAFAMTFYIRLY